MDSSLVETRMYPGCGNDPKNRKIIRQHVYIQKSLVDAWMNAYMNMTSGGKTLGRHLLLTFFMRLCLLRGLVTVVKLAFVPNIHLMEQVQGSSALASAHGPPCSFERFLWEWDCWVLFFATAPLHKGRPRFDKSMSGIVFSDRHSYCRVVITDDMTSVTNNSALKRFTAGDWTAFPPVIEGAFIVNHPYCIGVWDSPPTNGQDHIPQIIETTAWSNKVQEGTENTFDLSRYSPRRWMTVCR